VNGEGLAQPKKGTAGWAEVNEKQILLHDPRSDVLTAVTMRGTVLREVTKLADVSE
jgi:hypothetical protein